MAGPGTSEGSGASHKLSAVVVNYDAGEAIARCLQSLHKAGITDIVVVDNGSKDDSVEAVQALEPPIGLIRPVRNLGYGAGANLGARSVDGELIFICNPDLVVAEDALERLTRALEDRPDAAVAGPMLLEPGGAVYPSGRRFPSLGDSLGHGFAGLFWRGNPWTCRYRLIGEAQHVSRDADWVSGAGFLVRRSAFRGCRRVR